MTRAQPDYLRRHVHGPVLPMDHQPRPRWATPLQYGAATATVLCWAALVWWLL